MAVNILWMQEKYDLFLQGLFWGVLLELPHPLHLVDQMLMKTAIFPKEGFKTVCTDRSL
jgi:hypothetical protein